MAYLDRLRAQRLMAESDLDALILLSPESFRYATGAAAGVATMWRKAGAVAVLVPADANLPEVAVVSDLFADAFRRTSHIGDLRVNPLWVETATFSADMADMSAAAAVQAALEKDGRVAGFSRPTTFDPQTCFRHLADALVDRGLTRGRIGFEASALSVADFQPFRAALDGVTVVDATEVITRMKMVKSPAEIDNLRQAVDLAEQGIRAIRAAIAPGVTRDALAETWQAAIASAGQDIALTGSWEYISVGPNPWGGNKAVEPGDLVKVDVGCLVDGYTSDSARTFVFGRPTRQQSELYDALRAGFDAGAALLQPGVALAEVHRVTQEAIRAAGFSAYTRGHFGHGLGADIGSEQWPFIAADASVTFEPGMVMAFECPWYINGLGALIVENQLLITDHGHQMMNTLGLDLTVVG
ncbi:MAG: Xaa-Pro peptidase family protein [Pseudomonadota bacterium]